jgi:hypothetical protein
MNVKKLLIPMFALALGTAVAAPAQTPDVRAAAQDSVSQGVTIYVVNNNSLDMRVYFIVGSVRYRLGTVSGLGRQTLKVPASVVSMGNDIRLVAVPFGQRHGVSRTPVRTTEASRRIAPPPTCPWAG